MASSEPIAGLGEARRLTDNLFGLIRPEALYDRPIAQRHRFIFYLGHLEAFERNLLAPETVRGSFDNLFAFGIDPTDGALPDDKASDWPAIDQVKAYARRTRDLVDSVMPGSGAADPLLLNVVLEHRLMHAETLTYAMNQLPLDRKAARPFEPFAAPGRGGAGTAAGDTVEIPAGIATLGRRREVDSFGWDNEYEQYQVREPAFVIDRFNVTNAQFMRFVRAGGYQDRSLWSDEAWSWIQRDGIRHPGFWVRASEETWSYRAMFAEIPLPADWPVYVSHAEATAYARWRGAALPSETQWHRAACATRQGGERTDLWHDGNFDMRRWDPAPVGAWPSSDSEYGVADLAGNGWEWTSTPFAPFAGFEPFAFYPGYSADFFPHEGPNGTHYVMKGASPRTAARLVRRSFRNWFQPLYPHMYATFRCVTT